MRNKGFVSKIFFIGNYTFEISNNSKLGGGGMYKIRVMCNFLHFFIHDLIPAVNPLQLPSWGHR